MTKLITLRLENKITKVCSFKNVVTILSLLTRYSRLSCAARVPVLHEKLLCVYDVEASGLRSSTLKDLMASLEAKRNKKEFSK